MVKQSPGNRRSQAASRADQPSAEREQRRPDADLGPHQEISVVAPVERGGLLGVHDLQPHVPSPRVRQPRGRAACWRSTGTLDRARQHVGTWRSNGKIQVKGPGRRRLSSTC